MTIDIAAYRAVIERKLSEALDLGTADVPATERHIADEGRHRATAFTLAGPDESIWISREDKGGIELLFGRYDEPGYALDIHANDTHTVRYNGTAGTEPDLRVMLDKIEPLPISPAVGYFYGLVQNDVVIAWMEFRGVLCEHDGGYMPSTFVSYVLEGHEWPESLHMWAMSNEDWLQAFWLLVHQGQIVPLSARMAAWPGAIHVRGTRTKQSHIDFDGNDGKTPQLGTGSYLLWHPNERQAGDDFPRRPDGSIIWYSNHHRYLNERR